MMTAPPHGDPKLLANQIKAVSDEVDAIANRVYSLLDVPAGDSKPVPFYVSQPVSFMMPELTLRETAFVNQAEDFSILAMTYAVTAGGPNDGTAYFYPYYPAQSAPYFGPAAVHNAGSVLTTAPLPDLSGAANIQFGFNWNFRTKTGMTYGSEGSIDSGAPNSSLLPANVLGFSEHGNFLRFSRPQVVKAGESLMFSVKPTWWGQQTGRSMSEASALPTRVTVHVISIGYRDGRMAWPTIRK